MTNRPNIVFMMPDQLRHDFLSCYGASFIETPNIDRLGECGVRYTNAYSEHPVCVPARAALLTGMTAVKNGVLNNSSFLRPDHEACGIQTWPQILNASGYHTVATGKMHFYPWDADFGFKERIIAEDKLWGFVQDDYHDSLVAAGYSKRSFVEVDEYHERHQACISPLPWEHNVDHFVGQRSAEWIEGYEEEPPFAMMVGFPGPHSPYDPSSDYATFDTATVPEPIAKVEADVAMMGGKPRSGNRKASGRRSWYAVDNSEPPDAETHAIQRAYYSGLVAQIDVEVGRIVDALEAKGILDNTIILFSSDHGDYLGDHGLSGKGSFYEGSCHVPMLVRYPGKEGGVRDELVTLSDVTATILSLSGASVPFYMDSQPLPGVSGENARDMVFGVLSGGWMAFDGRWKLVKYPRGTQLFDLENDPTEIENRADDPACAQRLQALDTALTAEMMREVQGSTYADRIPEDAHSSSEAFGRRGWARNYPMVWRD